MQMMQQLTGIGFILYFGAIFLTRLGTIKNPFLIVLITTLVNVCSTPVSFFLVEKFGRRKILSIDGSRMVISQLIVGIIGVTAGMSFANIPSLPSTTSTCPTWFASSSTYKSQNMSQN
jgi:hypothetical protein